MPVENMLEAKKASKSAGVLQLSLLDVTSTDLPSSKPIRPSDLTTPLTFATAYATSSLTADALTRHSLSFLPHERASNTVANLWEKSSSQTLRFKFEEQGWATDNPFYKLESAQREYTVATQRAREYAQNLKPYAELAGMHARVLDNASPYSMRALARDLSDAHKAGSEIALQETQFALRSPTLHAADLETQAALKEYEALLLKNQHVSVEAVACRSQIADGAAKLDSMATLPYAHVVEARMASMRHSALSQLVDDPLKARGILKGTNTATGVFYGEEMRVMLHSSHGSYGRSVGHLFDYGSPLGKEISLLSEKVDSVVAAEMRVEKAQWALQKEKDAILTQTVGNQGLASGFGRKLAAGLGISTGVLSAGYGIDEFVSRQIGFDLRSRDDANRASLAVDGCLVPAVLLSDLPMKVRVPAAATAFVGMRLANVMSIDPDAPHKIPEILKPNHADTACLAMAVTAPLSGKLKVAAITAAMVPGRIVNLF